MHIIATNKKAFFNYEVIEEYVAGIKLEGCEIKSLRNQKPSFAGSFVTISHSVPYLNDLNIPRYKYDSSGDYQPKRKRILLLKKYEIARIQSKVNQRGVTIIPLAVILDRQWAKIKIGLVKGKKRYDKRRIIKDREDKIKVKRILKRY